MIRPILVISAVQLVIAFWNRRPPPPPPPLPPSSPPPSPKRVFSRQNSLDIEKTCEIPNNPPSELLRTVENIDDPTPVNPSYYRTQRKSPCCCYPRRRTNINQTVMDPSQLMRTDIPASCGLFACCSGRNCGCDKTVKFTNKMKDKYVDIWIRPSSRFYLSGFGFKDIQGQIERTGPDEIIQNVRIPPGDVMEISIETFSYFISAAIDDQQLWFNRRFFTSNDIVFYERQLRRLRPMCKSFKELIE